MNLYFIRCFDLTIETKYFFSILFNLEYKISLQIKALSKPLTNPFAIVDIFSRVLGLLLANNSFSLSNLIQETSN